MNLLFKRHDGTFVAEVNGRPYHVTDDDPLFAGAAEAAAAMGAELHFEPPPETPVVLQAPTVSRAQAQIALYNAGLLDQLEATIASHPYRPVRIWYESANYWERGHPYVQALAVDMGLTEEQVDDLWLAATRVVL